jgi:hypothetical protein
LPRPARPAGPLRVESPRKVRPLASTVDGEVHVDPDAWDALAAKSPKPALACLFGPDDLRRLASDHRLSITADEAGLVQVAQNIGRCYT